MTFILYKILLCCPVLKPQMTGEPLFPGEVTLNESVKHAPMDPPIKVGLTKTPVVVPSKGPAMSKV